MADPMVKTRDQQARYDIGALEQRVSGVEKGLGDLSSLISSLGTKIDERSKTPWVTFLAALTFLLMFVTAIGAAVYQPIRGDLDRHERRLDQADGRYIQDLKDEIKTLRGK